MARKSTSQFKMVKNEGSQKWVKEQQQLDLPPIEETFDNAKQAFVNTLEVSIQLASRIDNLMNIRDYAYKFWGKRLDEKYLGGERVVYFKKLMDISVETYTKILERVRTFELDEFTKDDMKDYFEDIMPSTEDIQTEDDMCVSGLIFLTVKPYGEKMTQLHHTMLDEKRQREFLERDEA